MDELKLKRGSPAQRAGVKGERIALWSLRLRGYRLLERNYRVGHKEIDLIMRRGRVIAFIEVKARYGSGEVLPRSSVDMRKRKNIIDASRYYIASCGLSEAVFRYDIMEVDLKSRRAVHIPNAYYPKF